MKQNGHKVRIGKLSEFRPQVANANKHTERGLRMLDDAMSEDGYVAPATAAADGEVIDGSARLERAFDKFSDEAIILEHDGRRPIIAVRTDIPNAQTSEAKRIAVRANRIAQVDLEWNPEILAELAPEEIKGMFSDKELAEILSQTGVEPATKDVDIDIDKAAELQQKWQVVTGEIIEIGKHRLMCGDSTSSADVERLLGDGRRVQAVVTDPPYNIGFKYDGPYKGKDAKRSGDYGEFLRAFLSLCDPFADDGCPFFVWQAQLNVAYFHEWFAGRDWRLFASCKNFIQARPTWLNYAWDPIVVWIKGERKTKNHVGIRDWHLAETSITAQTDDRVISGLHPCPRPLDAVEYVIKSHSEPSSVIYDAFAGSGTTLVAAENLNRKCYAMEISPAYCAVTLERMSTAFPNLKIERSDKAVAA